MNTSQSKPTIEQIESWDKDKLLEWIQQELPGLLTGDDLEKFNVASIRGRAFVKYGGDVEFFSGFKLPYGSGYELAGLAREIVEGETVDAKSMSIPFIQCTPRRQQANNLIAYRQQAGDAEMSDTPSKKRRLESEAHSKLQLLATSARRQRERIRHEIEKLNQSSISSSKESEPIQHELEKLDLSSISPSEGGVQRPNSVLQLANPALHTKLPFPFVGGRVPDRFHVNDDDDERNWFYTGREKFVELFDEFEHIRKDPRRGDLTIYGTRGYGKSHLLAALVCHLAAREVKVVYIPDCRTFVRTPVEDMMSAMLFAWADDKSKQQKIMALDTEDKISLFFKAERDVILVIDQVNALEKEESDNEFTANVKAQVHTWLQSLMSWHKSILSSSANNHSILNTSRPGRQSSSEIMYVHGGLTRVSLRSHNTFY